MGDVVLRGKPGMVTLHLADGTGAGGASALAPDTLELNLAPGPMAVRHLPAHPVKSVVECGHPPRNPTLYQLAHHAQNVSDLPAHPGNLIRLEYLRLYILDLASSRTPVWQLQYLCCSNVNTSVPWARARLAAAQHCDPPWFSCRAWRSRTRRCWRPAHARCCRGCACAAWTHAGTPPRPCRRASPGWRRALHPVSKI